MWVCDVFEVVQDVFCGDCVWYVCYYCMDQWFEVFVFGGCGGQVFCVDCVDDCVVWCGCDVCCDVDEVGGVDCEVWQYVCVVVGEVYEVGLVEYVVYFGEVVFGVFDCEDVWVFCKMQDCFVFDWYVCVVGDVVEDYWKVGCVGDELEMCQDVGLGWFVVVWCDDYDVVGVGFFVCFVQFDCVGGFVGIVVGDDFGVIC